MRRGMNLRYWWESQKEREYWEDQDVGGVDNSKMDIREVGCGFMDWIGLIQDRDHWRALVNLVMNIWVP
jgi:hypothetical protein